MRLERKAGLVVQKVILKTLSNRIFVSSGLKIDNIQLQQQLKLVHYFHFIPTINLLQYQRPDAFQFKFTVFSINELFQH